MNSVAGTRLLILVKWQPRVRGAVRGRHGPDWLLLVRRGYLLLVLHVIGFSN